MGQQHWEDPAPPASPSPTPPDRVDPLQPAHLGGDVWGLAVERSWGGALEALLCVRQRRAPGCGPGRRRRGRGRGRRGPTGGRPAAVTTPHYAEAFHAAEGRCFRFVSVAGTHGQPTHCPAPPAWRGLYVAGNGRGYRVEACDGHRGSLTQAQRLPPP